MYDSTASLCKIKRALYACKEVMCIMTNGNSSVKMILCDNYYVVCSQAEPEIVSIAGHVCVGFHRVHVGKYKMKKCMW